MPLDWQRLTGFALHVAEVRSATPPSTRVDMTHTEVRHGLFGLSKRVVSEPVSVPMDGWILLADPFEGWAQYESWPASGSTSSSTLIRGVEEGRLLLLRRDGVLVGARYRIDYNNQVGGRVNESHDVQIGGPADVEQVTSFDRLNRGSYRRTRTTGRGVGREQVVWREELAWRGPAQVTDHGIETRRALSKFRKQGVHVNSLHTPYSSG